MSGIFISYRRDDSEGQAGRLFEGLKARFGQDCVFIDVAGIEPGRDFRRIIEEHVSSCVGSGTRGSDAGLRSPNKCRKALANDACDRPRAFEGAALAVDHESGRLPRRQVRLEKADERQQALLVSFIRRARPASPASAGNVYAGNVYKVDRGRRVGSGAAALHELRTEAVGLRGQGLAAGMRKLSSRSVRAAMNMSYPDYSRLQPGRRGNSGLGGQPLPLGL